MKRRGLAIGSVHLLRSNGLLHLKRLLQQCSVLVVDIKSDVLLSPATHLAVDAVGLYSNLLQAMTVLFHLLV